MKITTSLCKACFRVYSLESSKSGYCCQCTSLLDSQKNVEPNMECKKCDRTYYSPNLVENCPICSVKKYKTLGKVKEKKYDNLKVKKKKKGLPLEEIIRRQEWRRVMDDDGWDHYLSGKKYDKI